MILVLVVTAAFAVVTTCMEFLEWLVANGAYIFIRLGQEPRSIFVAPQPLDM